MNYNVGENISLFSANAMARKNSICMTYCMCGTLHLLLLRQFRCSSFALIFSKRRFQNKTSPSSNMAGSYFWCQLYIACINFSVKCASSKHNISRSHLIRCEWVHGLNNKKGTEYLLGVTCTHGGCSNPPSDVCLVKVMEHTTFCRLQKPIISLFTSKNTSLTRLYTLKDHSLRARQI